MFTGIIEETGKVERIRRGIPWQFTLRAEKVTEDLKVGDSMSVNGVCLTVTQLKDSTFSVDVTAETLKRSNLGRLTSGSAVNLERAVRALDRLGGHLVSGHTDGMGTVAQRTKRSGAEIVKIRVPEEILRYVVPQGSVAVDGVSLTVLDTFPDSFAASLIPHTALLTTLATKRIGEKVNIEVDVVGKYVERFLKAKH
jgi:riboflavin synthase